MPKIEVSGWIGANDVKISNIPTICKCGTKLKKVNAINECNILFVYCPNLKCRYCEIFTT